MTMQELMEAVAEFVATLQGVEVIAREASEALDPGVSLILSVQESLDSDPEAFNDQPRAVSVTFNDIGYVDEDGEIIS